MTDEKFEKYLKEVQKSIFKLHNQFYVWKALKNKDYQGVYNRNKYFWSTVIYSLEKSFFLDLAELFNKKKDTISIYSLLNFVLNEEERIKFEQKLKSYKDISYKLWKWRCKVFAHKDKQTFFNLKKFYKKFPLKYGDEEKLLILAKTLLGEIDSAVRKKGHSYSYNVIERKSQKDVENIISKLN